MNLADQLTESSKLSVYAAANIRTVFNPTDRRWYIQTRLTLEEGWWILSRFQGEEIEPISFPTFDEAFDALEALKEWRKTWDPLQDNPTATDTRNRVRDAKGAKRPAQRDEAIAEPVAARPLTRQGEGARPDKTAFESEAHRESKTVPVSSNTGTLSHSGTQEGKTR